MYKDKHLQQAANRRASQKRRDKAKGMTRVPDKGMTTTGYDAPGVTVVCQTCGGPVQHPKIVKCYQCVHGKPAAQGVS